jgi:hypothetical protein
MNKLEKFENMALKRFDNFQQIRKHLEKIFETDKVLLVKKTRDDDEAELDFCLIGEVYDKNNKEEILYYIDLFYLKDNGRKILITETGYEVA